VWVRAFHAVPSRARLDLRSIDQHNRSAPNAAQPRRVLILSADVGEGHAAAARALRDQLERSDEPVEVTLIDGLAAMGPLLRSVVEDGYRTQLRVAPGSYSVYYWLLKHLPPMRAATKLMLTRLGAKSLRRAIEEHAPDVVVSTYPAITVVLGYLRRRRLLDMPTVATITDMTGLFFWAQRGIDTHLVMYEASVRDVERIAGRGSAQIVAPLIAAEFLEPRERGAARDALGLPRGGHVVVVSGGGWGVGDIMGAVRELAQIPDATIVCLAGHNDAVRDSLTEQFAATDRVRVLGFTNEMSELLAAADVLVHSTGGVTCLEAMARGCPVVSYGLPVGHAKLNTRRMAEHELLALANSTEELVEHVERARRDNTPRHPAAAVSEQIDAAAAVLRAPVRVRQLARWRMRATRTATSIVLALGVGAWLMSTDELDAFASVLVGHPVRTVASLKAENAVAVIVRAPTADLRIIVKELGRDRVRASFASTVAPSAATLATLHAAGDRIIPEINRSNVLGWIHTPALLRHDARALHLHHRFFYLAPANATFGQLLLAHIDDAVAVVGSVQFDSTTPLSAPPVVRAGDVVVVTLAGSAGSARAIDAVAVELKAAGLAGLPFSPPAS
jgi:processive 1,2-diacylglycerol beta-glucosyltransferase